MGCHSSHHMCPLGSGHWCVPSQGSVVFSEGEIVHAEVGDTEGEDAMVALLDPLSDAYLREIAGHFAAQDLGRPDHVSRADDASHRIAHAVADLDVEIAAVVGDARKAIDEAGRFFQSLTA